ncbi:hypothetical protein A4H97_17750 [Niastella yeongjuensis]|uniref:Uncharacterized protein n=1 Tax=Niastella yeongjuensis TaxID=354355 RepID=A0A1V9E1V3_9BACT|nr:hypothetical protein [Niastella yeongjuensis]OQP40059.1 hypothetical protein A4H97_17750 [Niastella yeongjuensis]SEO15300.1 hypothetical protein SAMN05660816_02295 [Niastella yeongjuensis]
MTGSSAKRNCLLSGPCWLVLLLHVLCTTASAQQRYYKADQQITFKWRYGYSEFPFPAESTVAQEDAQRGTFGWYDGALWSQAYKWNDSTILHGVQLLFRGGSPYAREVMCTSDLVPYQAAGAPVSFLMPFQYTIGSEEELAFSLRIKGSTEETIVCKLHPKAVTTFTGGLFKVSFITLKVSSPEGPKPLVTVTGMMHIRAYPQLINYGNRLSIIFSSVTHHMDVESSLVLGSVFKNMAEVDPYQLADNIKLSSDSITAAWQRHDTRLRQWRQTTAQRAASLLQKGRVEVACQGPVQPRDKGELRVMAYSGNPVKDFQYGPPSSQMKEMAQAVTTVLGRHFSLFRYQHHYLPWKMDKPAELDSTQLPYLQQWLEAAGAAADTVLLDLQLSPIVKLYKQYSQMGQLPLPAAGIPGVEWDKIKQGYLTTLIYAKKICPALRIVQMPYELDNITNTAVHADAHYQFFKCLYEAVASFNALQRKGDQLLIAGLGSNNPTSRRDFIKGFLQRYSMDTSSNKHLDFITWHTYLFPGNYPAQIKGVADSLQRFQQRYHLEKSIPVIVDEMGLAEPSTIEDLSDLQGAMKKEAAMACFTTALQDYYEKEPGTFFPISGAGWHFALLTYGKQNVLSTYAKGLVLRSKLGDEKLPVHTTPVDAEGWGLHAVATKERNKLSVLLFSASPSIFYEQAAPLNYSDIDLIIKDLPASFRNTKLKITQWYSSPGDEGYKQILSQEKYQTLPLTRGADRYEKDFSPGEVKRLNEIKTQTTYVQSGKENLTLSAAIDAYGMRLIQIEPVQGK